MLVKMTLVFKTIRKRASKDGANVKAIRKRVIKGGAHF